jgi:ABC-type polysaccharide/polyol phosphate transport system ATPase subunit
LAVRINRGEKKIYQRLKVAQLIKHVLGLKNQFKGMQNFDLVYLWYPAPGFEAVEHEDEIRTFQKLTDACHPKIRFRAVTYTNLIHALAAQHGDVHGAYVDYLMERYF